MNAQISMASGLSKSAMPSRAWNAAAFFANVLGTMRPSNRGVVAAALEPAGGRPGDLLAGSDAVAEADGGVAAAKAVSTSRTECIPLRLREPYPLETLASRAVRMCPH